MRGAPLPLTQVPLIDEQAPDATLVPMVKATQVATLAGQAALNAGIVLTMVGPAMWLGMLKAFSPPRR